MQRPLRSLVLAPTNAEYLRDRVAKAVEEMNRLILIVGESRRNCLKKMRVPDMLCTAQCSKTTSKRQITDSRCFQGSTFFSTGRYACRALFTHCSSR